MKPIFTSEFAFHTAGVVALTVLLLGMAEYVSFEFMVAAAFAAIMMGLNQ